MLAMDGRHIQGFPQSESSAAQSFRLARAAITAEWDAKYMNPLANRPAEQRPLPTLPPAAGFSTSQRKEALRQYNAELMGQQAHARQAAEFQKIFQKYKGASK